MSANEHEECKNYLGAFLAHNTHIIISFRNYTDFIFVSKAPRRLVELVEYQCSIPGWVKVRRRKTPRKLGEIG